MTSRRLPLLVLIGTLGGCGDLPPSVFCPAALPQVGAKFSGPVALISSGRSLCIGDLTARETLIPVTVQGLNAPGVWENGGKKAFNALQAKVLHRTLECAAISHEEGSVVARCELDGVELTN